MANFIRFYLLQDAINEIKFSYNGACSLRSDHPGKLKERLREARERARVVSGTCWERPFSVRPCSSVPLPLYFTAHYYFAILKSEKAEGSLLEM